MTLDILQTAGPSRDVMLIGAGQNELEDDSGTRRGRARPNRHA